MSYVNKWNKERLEKIVSQDGRTLHIGIAPQKAGNQIRIGAKLIRAIGPAILPFADGQTSVADLLQRPEAVKSIVGTLYNIETHMDDLLAIAAMFCDRTQFSWDGERFTVMGRPDVAGLNGFDEVFSGDMDMVAEWFKLHLDVNFKNFLVWFKNAIPADDQSNNSQKVTG